MLLKLSGEPACMQLLCETPGTFQVLVDMLGLSSHMASESASALCYRIALERHYRPELGGTGRCLEEKNLAKKYIRTCIRMHAYIHAYLPACMHTRIH